MKMVCSECMANEACVHLPDGEELCAECAARIITQDSEIYGNLVDELADTKGRMYRLRDAAAAGNRLWRAILGGGPGTHDDKMLEIQVAITETTAAMHKLEPGDLVAPPRGD
jgi:hypothetical protein